VLQECFAPEDLHKKIASGWIDIRYNNKIWVWFCYTFGVQPVLMDCAEETFSVGLEKCVAGFGWYPSILDDEAVVESNFSCFITLSIKP
jgi:hypothetical protein